MSIINSFINLIKLEHHRNFLEFCNAENVVPFGLRIKKVPSLLGRPCEDFEQSWKDILDTAQGQLMTLLIVQYREPGGGGYFTINSYGGVRRKDFCYDPIPEIWSDIDTQSQNICQILIPNRRRNKSNSTSKG